MTTEDPLRHYLDSLSVAVVFTRKVGVDDYRFTEVSNHGQRPLTDIKSYDAHSRHICLFPLRRYCYNAPLVTKDLFIKFPL